MRKAFVLLTLGLAVIMALPSVALRREAGWPVLSSSGPLETPSDEWKNFYFSELSGDFSVDTSRIQLFLQPDGHRSAVEILEITEKELSRLARASEWELFAEVQGQACVEICYYSAFRQNSEAYQKAQTMFRRLYSMVKENLENYPEASNGVRLSLVKNWKAVPAVLDSTIGVPELVLNVCVLNSVEVFDGEFHDSYLPGHRLLLGKAGQLYSGSNRASTKRNLEKAFGAWNSTPNFHAAIDSWHRRHNSAITPTDLMGRDVVGRTVTHYVWSMRPVKNYYLEREWLSKVLEDNSFEEKR